MTQFRYILIVLVPLLTFIVGWVSGQQASEVRSQGNTVAEQQGDKNLLDMWFGKEGLSIDPESIDLSLFWTVWDQINKGYVDMEGVSKEAMVYGAIKGLTESLQDPYSYFLPPSESKEFNDSLNGDLEGIGAEISKKDGKIVVVSPLKNSPAERAGLLPGDHIIFIGDKSTVDMDLYEAVSMIRGNPGSEVKLVILREGEEEAREFNIKRESITVPSVTYELKDGNIAYIEVNQFGGNTVQEFEKVVADLGIKKPAGLVLDLRYNGGGYLDGAVDMISFFVKEGKAVTVKMRDTSKDETHYVNGKAPLATTPLVVLINKGSASASEIVAGAIQDYKRGVLIGETTFGKGSVQELLPLSDGSSLRLTIAKWFTPNDRNINHEGIAPDIAIEMTPEDLEKDRDPQLERALKYLRDKEYEKTAPTAQ